MIRDGQVTSEEAVRACIERSHEVNPILNAIVGNRFEGALEEARRIDVLLKSLSEGERMCLSEEKPLLGVPFTVKENIKLKGMSHTAAVWSLKGRVADGDAEVVLHLRKSGGVPMGVTNVPEMALWWETNSLLFGRTCSPYDPARTSGGSSGGEAALLSSCGSFAGVGTDIGGSIRIPANFCGIFGHKPTPGIVPTAGTHIQEKSSKVGISVTGPLARYAEDLPVLLEAMGPMAAGVRKRTSGVTMKDLTVWYTESFEGNPMVGPVDGRIISCIHEALKHLKHEGASVRKWPLPLDSTYGYWLNKLGDDNRHGPPFVTVEKLSAVLKAWSKWLIGKSPHHVSTLMKKVIMWTVPTGEFQASPHYWKKAKLEFERILGEKGVLVLPTNSLVAPFHNHAVFVPHEWLYTGLFNSLELPATQVPMGVDGGKEPLGIQVASSSNMDHLCLAVAIELEKKFGGWKCPSQVLQ